MLIVMHMLRLSVLNLMNGGLGFVAVVVVIAMCFDHTRTHTHIFRLRAVRLGGFETGDIVWFPDADLNASYNCVDRWAFKHPDKV